MSRTRGENIFKINKFEAVDILFRTLNGELLHQYYPRGINYNIGERALKSLTGEYRDHSFTMVNVSKRKKAIVYLQKLNKKEREKKKGLELWVELEVRMVRNYLK